MPGRPDCIDDFNETERALMSWSDGYLRKEDGTLSVLGDLNISGKELAELPDLSCVTIQGSFNCSGNLLTSLKGAPKAVGKGFDCSCNQLTSLEHAPDSIPGDFLCDNNKLTTLNGGPHTVGHFFYCTANPLTSLEGAPIKFGRIDSDWDRYDSWDEIPDYLQVSPQTLERKLQELAEAKEQALRAATVLQEPLIIHRPLKLRR